MLWTAFRALPQPHPALHASDLLGRPGIDEARKPIPAVAHYHGRLISPYSRFYRSSSEADTPLVECVSEAHYPTTFHSVTGCMWQALPSAWR